MAETQNNPVGPVTAAERERAFREAIEAVCKEHGAALEVTDDGQSYGMQNGVLKVTMMSIWDGDRLVKDFCQFDW